MVQDQRPATARDAGSVPSCASVALPAKVIASPTFHVVPAAGAVIVAVGGVLPTLIETAAVLDAPAAVGHPEARRIDALAPCK